MIVHHGNNKPRKAMPYAYDETLFLDPGALNEADYLKLKKMDKMAFEEFLSANTSRRWEGFRQSKSGLKSMMSMSFAVALIFGLLGAIILPLATVAGLALLCFVYAGMSYMSSSVSFKGYVSAYQKWLRKRRETAVLSSDYGDYLAKEKHSGVNTTMALAGISSL